MKEESKAYTCVTAGRLRRRKHIFGMIVLILMIVAGGIYLGSRTAEEGFVPQPFEQQAVSGIPNPPQDLGYTEIPIEQGYSVFLCGRLFEEDGRLPVYFTNPKNNQVWTQIQVFAGTTELARSGIIRPGEYVKSIKLQQPMVQGETDIEIRILAYTPESYISRGSVSVNTKIIG